MHLSRRASVIGVCFLALAVLRFLFGTGVLR
jgi:hypothetical protein